MTQRNFILLCNSQIEAVTADWNGMRDYCSETGKRGDVFVVETAIPFGGKMSEVSTQTKFFGEIE